MSSTKFGMPELRQATISYLKGIPNNHETEALLNKILPLYQQVFRDREFEDLCKSIRNGVIPGSTPRPAPIPVTEVRQEPMSEKKIVETSPIVMDVDSKPKEEVRDSTNDTAIMELYTECNTVEKLQSKFSKPSEVKKALSVLGINSKGNYEDHLASLKQAWDNLNK